MEWVDVCRQQAAGNAGLQRRLAGIKSFQRERFASTYQDLLQHPLYTDAANFFLHELYGDADYRERDAGFARIAAPLERIFPEAVAQTALHLAQLHCVTEQLDLRMAGALPVSVKGTPDDTVYQQAWLSIGCGADRDFQLQTVLEVGRALAGYTRQRGLRMLLRLMRPAALASGLGALQSFLEQGFDTFAVMSKDPATVQHFLDTIAQREGQFIARMAG